ncbi:PAS domain S-box-containing protein [Sphingomonas jinjuensis]|uniref:histidine kinase n=1 Tax=Sphingomonas jinjuensis TaxID=535907 RepID=A0A840FHB3_9SPHN|nr:PAS domain-containing sensor histidine kinase [Sphingomonas jinjuensis]MBB4153368.1 PAS domain S-box-containing protein [Sphingomonas jinjuensis]
MTTISAATLPPHLGFLAGGGEATQLILARDWTDHPLGPPERWPAPFKTALSLLLNSPESMILCWGAEELFFFFNETYFPLLGPRLSWAMGSRMDQVWADAWDQAKPIIDDAFAGRSQRFTDLPWKLATDRGAADTWWSFSYSRVLGETGDIVGLFIFTNETTKRVLADRALADSQEELRALNEDLERQVAQRTAERDRMWSVSPDLMVLVSHDGHWSAVNPAWTSILGYEAHELIGLHATALVHAADIAASSGALATAQAGTLPTFENRIRHKDGSYRWMQWVAAPTEDGVFAIGRHITDAKEAEEQLRLATEQLNQAQKMEAIGQLTGGVAHDFNNLLTIIRGSVELLRRDTLTPEKRSRYIEAIADTAERAAKLTGQLLAFARRQALTPELLDVGVAVGSIVEMVQTLVGSRVSLRFRPPAECCLAEVDRSQLETAVVNLAINGRDAMQGKGELTIAVAPADRIPSLRGHHGINGDFLVISVSDTGSGIAAADLPHIFEPFFTTKDVGKGTGLGLSQVIGFAKQSGGDVDVDSESGRGATFSLYLPRILDRDTPGDNDDDAEAPDGGGSSVLLVEDNEDVGRFAKTALDELGYRSVLVGNATAALALLDEDASRFDVVFSDVVMPGMNGVDLAATIRARHPALRVILTSGYSHVLAENAQHGFELLHKPYSVEQLSRALRKAIGWLPGRRRHP